MNRLWMMKIYVFAEATKNIKIAIKKYSIEKDKEFYTIFPLFLITLSPNIITRKFFTNEKTNNHPVSAAGCFCLCSRTWNDFYK